jgi:hypothetical protein
MLAAASLSAVALVLHMAARPLPLAVDNAVETCTLLVLVLLAMVLSSFTVPYSDGEALAIACLVFPTVVALVLWLLRAKLP